jgi:hypothetical protein
METPIIATGAAALGLYMYLKGRTAASVALTDGGISPPASIEAWRHVEHAPNTWTETLYYFKEVFRREPKRFSTFSISQKPYYLKLFHQVHVL